MFKKRENYNEILILKVTIEELNQSENEGGKKGGIKNQILDTISFDLNSKRTFKKVYKGINFKDGKIDCYSLFIDTVNNIEKNSEKKLRFWKRNIKKIIGQ